MTSYGSSPQDRPETICDTEGFVFTPDVSTYAPYSTADGGAGLGVAQGRPSSGRLYAASFSTPAKRTALAHKANKLCGPGMHMRDIRFISAYEDVISTPTPNEIDLTNVALVAGWNVLSAGRVDTGVLPRDYPYAFAFSGDTSVRFQTKNTNLVMTLVVADYGETTNTNVTPGQVDSLINPPNPHFAFGDPPHLFVPPSPTAHRAVFPLTQWTATVPNPQTPAANRHVRPQAATLTGTPAPSPTSVYHYGWRYGEQTGVKRTSWVHRMVAGERRVRYSWVLLWTPSPKPTGRITWWSDGIARIETV